MVMQFVKEERERAALRGLNFRHPSSVQDSDPDIPFPFLNLHFMQNIRIIEKTEAISLRNLADLKGVVAPSSVEDIEPDTGCIVQQGTQKVALFKDADGTLHR
jgi:hypothetical protein